jgi:hypothetical protein
MKRRVFILLAVPLLLAAFQNSLEARGAKRYLTKESAADMTGMNRVYLGWIDMVPDDWAIHKYSDKTEWASQINILNNYLQRMCQTKYLPGRTVTGSKEKGDENPGDSDLYIKFSDVRIVYDDYYLYVSLHFIDPKTNSEIGTIPVRAYYGNDWGFENYLRAALDEVGVKIQVEILGRLLKGK